MPALRAILFDTFGTVVDWRTSLIADLTAFGAGRGIAADDPLQAATPAASRIAASTRASDRLAVT